MLASEVIRKKRQGLELSHSELKDFFGGYLKGAVADYQVSSMLMAMFLKGMSRLETTELTKIMRDSGVVFDWGEYCSLAVDKHSSGGVGDKTSIIIAALCCLEDVWVPMMAGRGLAHTGGTIDKLESIGWKVDFTPDEVRAHMHRHHVMIMAQSEYVAPLDKRLYSLRDVTATVESVPLIVASILSKKLAEGIAALVMDVKYGSGAFMPDLAAARVLAQELTDVGAECGITVQPYLTSMNSPLGNYAGHLLEIYECVQILNGGGPEDTRDLSIALAAAMVCLAHPEKVLSDVKSRMAGALQNGLAIQQFIELARAQGANIDLIEHPERLLRAKFVETAKVPLFASDKWVSSIDVRRLGLAIVELGGGRLIKDQSLDFAVGLSNFKKVGEKVVSGEVLIKVHGNDWQRTQKALAMVEGAYSFSDTQVNSEPLLFS